MNFQNNDSILTFYQKKEKRITESVFLVLNKKMYGLCRNRNNKLKKQLKDNNAGR